MVARCFGILALTVCAALAQETLAGRAEQYLVDLIRLNTTVPPGNETRVANYLRKVAEANGIPCELIGEDPTRLNFVARLKGSGAAGPLLLMAHSDVVPADNAQWSVEPFAARVRDGYIYGRGAVNDKSLLAAELAVIVDLKRRNVKLDRDIILLSEADEKAFSTGMRWIAEHAFDKIAADFAINEGGFQMDSVGGRRVFQVQTAEKIPTRVILTARGLAGHGSLPRADNAVVRLSRAIIRLAEAEQPVRLNTTTRRYFREIGKLAGYQWLAPLAPKLESQGTASKVAGQIRARDAELDAVLHTTVSPAMLNSGSKINVIPNTAEARIDVRRLPDETQEEVLVRFRQIVADPAVDVAAHAAPEMPATEPSSLTTALYKAMEAVFAKTGPRVSTIPYMSRGATGGAFLRAKGMAVYGAPIFRRDGADNRAHGNDERISIDNLGAGASLLMDIVLEVAAS